MSTEEALIVRLLAEDPARSLPPCPLLWPQHCFTAARPRSAGSQRSLRSCQCPKLTKGDGRKPSAVLSAKATGRGWSRRPPGA